MHARYVSCSERFSSVQRCLLKMGSSVIGSKKPCSIIILYSLLQQVKTVIVKFLK